VERSVEHYILPSLAFGKSIPVPIGQEAGWTTELVQMLQWKVSKPAGNGTMIP